MSKPLIRWRARSRSISLGPVVMGFGIGLWTGFGLACGLVVRLWTLHEGIHDLDGNAMSIQEEALNG